MASDDFNRANGGLGANWTVQNGSLAIVSNAVNSGTSAVDEQAFYNVGVWSNDQSSQVTQVLTASSSFVGTTVRASGTGGSSQHYMLIANDVNFTAVYRLVSNSYTLLSSAYSQPADGSVIKLDVAVTTLRVYDDGVQIGSDLSDGVIASGNPGIYGNGSAGTGTATLDAWVGTGDAGVAFMPRPGLFIGQAVNRASTF
jgi:hypothetical protein